jgi:hypothetical protein
MRVLRRQIGVYLSFKRKKKELAEILPARNRIIRVVARLFFLCFFRVCRKSRISEVGWLFRTIPNQKMSEFSCFPEFVAPRDNVTV